jgi:hypothetical protein
LLTIGLRKIELGRIAVPGAIRRSLWFAAIRVLRGAAEVVHIQEAFDV